MSHATRYLLVADNSVLDTLSWTRPKQIAFLLVISLLRMLGTSWESKLLSYLGLASSGKKLWILDWPIFPGVCSSERLPQIHWKKSEAVNWPPDVITVIYLMKMTSTCSFLLFGQLFLVWASRPLWLPIPCSNPCCRHLGGHFSYCRCHRKKRGCCHLLPSHLHPLVSSQRLQAQQLVIHLRARKGTFCGLNEGMILSLSAAKVSIHPRPIWVFLGMD